MTDLHIHDRSAALCASTGRVCPRRPSQAEGVTCSELAVVRLVADGLTNREVAERLYVSPHTVNGHLRHAFDKLGINSRVALTRIAAQHQD